MGNNEPKQFAHLWSAFEIRHPFIADDVILDDYFTMYLGAIIKPSLSCIIT